MKYFPITLIEVLTYTCELSIPAESVKEACEIALRLGMGNKKGLTVSSYSYTESLSPPEEIPVRVTPAEAQKLLDESYKDKIKPSTNVHDE
jgi:hypothetical protein